MNSPFLKGHEPFPKIDEKNKGKFTAWVKKNMPGKSTCAAASAVMKNKKKYKKSDNSWRGEKCNQIKVHSGPIVLHF